jgi:prephenate dehydrogenase
MAEVSFRPPSSVALVGLGAIGGSVALGLRAAGIGVVGFAGREDSALARRAGILTAETLAAAVRGAGLVVLAVPPAVVHEASQVVRDVTAAPVLHLTSVQRPSALGFADGEWMPIGAHPIAGSHRSGFAAADAALFRDCRVSVEARANECERALARWLWSTLGATRVEIRDAAAHDRQMAWVSHLPQLAGVALAAAIGQGGEPASALGPGGRDATRLAASRFELWSDILGANRDELVPALDAYVAELSLLRDAVAAAEMPTLGEHWRRARVWREGDRRR